MTVYTTVPLDDSNLDVTVTENADLVSIDIQPASFTGSGGGGGGAVSSVNAKIGIVVLDTDDIGEGVTNLYSKQPNAITDDVTFNSVDADMYGVSKFLAKNVEGVTILTGQPVYISGHSGNTPEIKLANNTLVSEMPAFGIAVNDIANNNTGEIATGGDLLGIDTTGTSEGEVWVVGNSLYVGNNKLTNVRPTGATDKVEVIGKVIRVHAQVGQLFLAGAGRYNDVPNLAAQNVFIGNGSGVTERQLDTDDVLEGTNLYYTDARAQTLIDTLPIAYTNADLTMSGNILPSIDSDGTTGYDLGSPTKKWKDLYLSEGSLYIDNQKVIESDSGTIVVRADVDQSLQTTVSGTGVLTLSSETTINVDSTLQMGVGKKITTSNGDPVEFGDKLNLDNNQIINLADPTAGGHATNKTYVDTALFNLVNGAPTQLDTLGEIANSLGDDAAFSTTMTNALALKDTITNVDIKDAVVLASAYTYTDTEIAAIPATDLTPYSTTVQVEALPVSTFTNDSGYATTTYVDTNDATTLASANSYTASRVLTDRGTGVTSTYVATVVVGGTTFNMPAVTGEIKSDQGYFAISYAGATGITVATLTAASTYVYLDNAGALQQQVTIPTRQDWSRKIFVMRIAVDLSNNTIIGFEYLNNPLGHYANSIRDVYEYLLAQGIPFKKDQLVTGRAADLGFDVSSGTLLEFGGTGDINNANILDFPAVSNAGFFLTTRTAFDAGGNTDLPKFWDNGGTLTALGSTTVVGHRIYRFSNGNLCLQYGQGNYANINLAEAGVLLEDYVLNPILKNATFFGWWLLQETATNTGGTTLTKFVDYTIGVSGGSSSGLSGALLKGNNLSDLIDAATARTNLGIDLTTLTDVVTINPDSAGMTIGSTGNTTLNWGSDAKVQWRSTSDGGAVNQWVFDNTAANIFTGMHWRTDANKKIFRFDAVASGGVDPGDGSHQTNFVLSGVNNIFKSRQHNETKTGLLFDASYIDLDTDNGVSINGNFTFPQVDGTVDQVMSTDGTGTLSWVTASGGGATALADLSDVSELNLQNNDLLMYNSTASEWQNTNLGVSVTPTLSGAVSILAGTSYTITISNHATYDDPAYFVEVYTGTTRVVINDNVTDNQDGTLTFTAPAAGTHQIRVKCQDFGDLQSEIATYALTTSQFGGTYRYWRLTAVTSDGPTNYWGIWDLRFYTGAGQSGVQYPSNMSSDTAPSPYVASALHTYNSTYGPFRAFDSSINSFYWTIGSSSTSQQQQWLKLDLGSAVSISSMKYYNAGNTAYFPRSMTVEASNTGAFTGEETVIATLSGLPITNTTYVNIG